MKYYICHSRFGYYFVKTSDERFLNKNGKWMDMIKFVIEPSDYFDFSSRRQAIQKLKEVEGANVRFQDG